MLKRIILPAFAAFVALSSPLFGGQRIVSIVTDAPATTFAATDILQIVGVLSNDDSAYAEFTYAGGLVVRNRLTLGAVGTGSTNTRVVHSVQLLGATLTGITSVKVVSGTGSLTVKVLNQPSEMVSDPVMLPVTNDEKFAISLETSVDMVNWAPAAPGDYLGSSSHRYFRLKAVSKPETSTPAE